MVEDDFRVELDAFAGPLDLLLYLIQKEEVDVHDIPVSRILERYLETLRSSNVLDLDRAGEFLVMASTLMAVKSAMLLPGGDADVEDLVDPREDLVRQLIEYRRVKETGEQLRELREEAALRFPRGRAPLPEVEEGAEGEPAPVREVTLFDVFSTFQRLLRETDAEAPRRIVYDDVPQERHIDRILQAVGEGNGRATLPAILGERRDRLYVLGAFLALLELMKEGKVLAVQTGTDPEIEIVLQESETGRAILASLRFRARRYEAETPEGMPGGRRPPWAKKGGDAPPAGEAPKPEAEEESPADAAGDDADAATGPPSPPPPPSVPFLEAPPDSPRAAGESAPSPEPQSLPPGDTA